MKTLTLDKNFKIVAPKLEQVKVKTAVFMPKISTTSVPKSSVIGSSVRIGRLNKNVGK